MKLLAKLLAILLAIAGMIVLFGVLPARLMQEALWEETQRAPTRTLVSTGTFSPVPSSTPLETGMVRGSWYCRQSPRVGAVVVATVRDGQEVRVRARWSGWVRVQVEGVECWLVEAALEVP